MENQFKKLRRWLILLTAYCLLTTFGMLGMFLIQKQDPAAQKVIRTQGLVIEDANGKPRILLGPPIPLVPERIRTDTSRVREIWAPNFTPREDWFMDLYKTYQHDANGIVFLDENGHDRIAIGDPVPDPWFGKRIGASTGMIIQDDEGLERTGYGLLKVNGMYRANLGFDYPGREGMTFSLDDSGQTGISIRDMDKSIFIGKADSTNFFTGDDFPFNGMLIKGPADKEYRFNSFEDSSDTPN